MPDAVGHVGVDATAFQLVAPKRGGVGGGGGVLVPEAVLDTLFDSLCWLLLALPLPLPRLPLALRLPLPLPLSLPL